MSRSGMVVLRLLCFLALAVAKQSNCPPDLYKGTAVTTMCSAHFPDAKASKIWMLEFYAPWCGHCIKLKPDYIELAKKLKGNKEIGVGAVDCDQHKDLCGQHGIKGFPTLKVFSAGKLKEYKYGRDPDTMHNWLVEYKEKRGSKGGSKKCGLGSFKGSDPVIPLCDSHFPDNTSKNQWLILFYNKSDKIDRKMWTSIAKELGNESAGKKSQKQKDQRMKQTQRLEALQKEHSLSFDIPKKGYTTKDPLVKFGAVCCDCDETKKCEGKDVPTLMYKKKAAEKDSPMGNQAEILAGALENMGFTVSKESKEEL